MRQRLISRDVIYPPMTEEQCDGKKGSDMTKTDKLTKQETKWDVL